MATRIQRSLTALVLTTVSLALAACSDSVTAPAERSLQPSAPKLTIGTTSTFAFTLNPAIDNIYQSAEGHRIVIPAYSICNPLTSGYGSSTWNQACSPAMLPILFTITTRIGTDGLPKLTVQPDVRFSPSKQVMVFFKDPVAASTPGAVIKYCTLLGCIDEGKTDPTMKTYQDPASGYIFRRLKHFSGYHVIFGFSCDPTSGDPDCVDDGIGGILNRAPLPVNRFSGYITTVGLVGNDELTSGEQIDGGSLR